MSIIQNTCWECENGWILVNEQQINQEQGIILTSFEYQCIPNCGDNLIVGYEQCDDGNSNPQDGCYNCLFQCEVNCLICDFGICKQCRQGYHLNQVCEPICGDGQLIPYIEECDDQNSQQGDGCFDCQLECIENCIYCTQALCLKCAIGYQLFQNQCIPFCGDQLILPDYEECDDGNDIQYDGCYECKYQCNITCQNCIQGICKDQCNYGDIMINYQCQSVCGNQIKTGQEECDDGNNIQYDGCYQCKYSCPLYCDYCEQGICLECYNQLIQTTILKLFQIKQLMYQY